MLNFLFTSRKVGVRSKPPRNNRIGMVSPAIAYGLLVDTHHAVSIDDVPRTGAPSMISNFVIVSDSLYWFGGAPVFGTGSASLWPFQLPAGSGAAVSVYFLYSPAASWRPRGGIVWTSIDAGVGLR